MKIIIILACAFLAVNTTSDEDQWTQFKAKYGKHYRKSIDENDRFKVFQKNLRKIQDHNQKYANGEVSYTLGINKFADLTQEEFTKRLNEPRRVKIEHKQRTAFPNPTSEVPGNIDWRTQGAVTEVKDQGECGGCWAFSSTGSLEGQYYLKTGSLLSLSEQYLVDCSYNNNDCRGGWTLNAFLFIRTNGIVSEESYPYEAEAKTCRANGTMFKDIGISVVSQDEEDIKVAVATNGPVSVSVDASTMYLYDGGVLSDSGCSREFTNHAVLIVGYGTTDDGIDYWLVKNSWGADWGDDGYLRMRNYGKSYRGISEEQTRYEIFQNNVRIIDQHNLKYERGEVTYRLGVNKFADMSEEEFFAARLNKTEYKSTLEVAPLFSLPAGAEVPQEIDWRDEGIVSKVKDQGTCSGSFYFAALGLLETYNYLGTGVMLDLSEQCLIDCSFGFNNGCNGGGLLNTIEYVRNRGIAYEEDYPYKGVEEECRDTARNLEAFGYKIIQAGTEALRGAVGTIGPIGVSFDGSQLLLYSGGVYNNLGCNRLTNQSGIVVGYGRTSSGEDYWIIKLSFGADWGEDGYVRIARDAEDLCGVSAIALYPVL